MNVVLLRVLYAQALMVDGRLALGRLLDYSVIGTRIEVRYASAAHALGELRLLGMVRNGAPVYAWRYEMRHVWRRPTSRVLRFLTRPPRAA